MKGQSLREYKKLIVDRLLSDDDLLQAIVNTDIDFLATDKRVTIDNKNALVYDYIFPYKKISTSNTEAKTFVVMSFTNIKKKSNAYKSGHITFFIVCTESMLKTKQGLRYDYIADKIDDLFLETGSGIGSLEFLDRGDIEILSGYYVHYIRFEITDFYEV